MRFGLGGRGVSMLLGRCERGMGRGGEGEGIWYGLRGDEIEE